MIFLSCCIVNLANFLDFPYLLPCQLYKGACVYKGKFKFMVVLHAFLFLENVSLCYVFFGLVCRNNNLVPRISYLFDIGQEALGTRLQKQL